VIDGVFVGLTTFDIVYQVNDFPAANTKVAALSQDLFIGGPATNAAIAYSALGGKAALISAVGRHPITAIAREEFKRHSLEFVDLSPEFDGLPALSSVSVDKSGRRNVVSANASRLPISGVTAEPELCRQAKVLMVDGHAMAACMAWASTAKESGTPVVFDGGSWKDGTEDLLKYVDTAICSADFRAPGCVTEIEVAEFFESCSVANVAITHGAGPIRFFAAQGSGEIEVPRVQAVDTMGAGDIFHGAFCRYFSGGTDFVESLKHAATIASDSCRQRGTRSWMENLSAKRVE
jgi:sugar/nucleoside kinase (ribokinase family)